MKIIVTGGAGFIGSHVAHAYIRAGHRVVVIDNLSKGSLANIPTKAKFYKADIRDANTLDKIFHKEKPDVINHHAAFISVTESVKNPEKTFETNVTGTLNVLLAFAGISPRNAKKKFIFSSTGGAIYGNPKKLPASESTPPMPLSPYALTKIISEEMISYFCGAYGIQYLIFRYANVYGPRQRAQGGAGIFPIFTNKMRRGETPVIFGNGKKTRDYVYVEDVARANVLGLSRGANDIMNISTGREISDDHVFHSLANIIGFHKKAQYKPTRRGEVKRISMSFAKARKVLGWEPKTTWAEGIKMTCGKE